MVLTLVLALILGLLIYWREYATRELVSPVHVILWQVGIWLPWTIAFMALKKIAGNLRKDTFGLVLLIVCGFAWVLFHYDWFVLLSSRISPYLGLPGSRFGVYRYFFIFWSLIDLGLLWFIIDKLHSKESPEEEPPRWFELTRGAKTFLCKASQIHYLTAENYYTRLHTTEGTFMMRKSLKSFDEVLPENMFRKIHRSTIINVHYVSELSRGADHHLEVILKDGTTRRVSRRFAKDLTGFFRDKTY